MSTPPLPIVIRCAKALLPKVRYVFDTLFMAAGIPVTYAEMPPSTGPWLLYGPGIEPSWEAGRCVGIGHSPDAWRFLNGSNHVVTSAEVDGLAAVFPDTVPGFEPPLHVPFDVVANAFFFLSSWSERVGAGDTQSRRLYANSVISRLAVPQDVVDRYLQRLSTRLDALCDRLGLARWAPLTWPGGARFAVVLSHDIDFLPSGIFDTLAQGSKTLLRHLVRQRDPGDALQAAIGLARALVQGRDPYGCIPQIIEREKRLGVSASFQVAVGHRHPNDVNYRIEEDRVRDYLRAIPDAGFDLCLHGSYRSTENIAWYVEEVALLTERLGKPLGSRQHFLSFNYDSLFSAQEQAGISYDMSMGFPDRIGPRAGFSYPYFPYCLSDDRPYDVLQISLFLMDVTLRSYMRLKGKRAWAATETTLRDLREKRGCVSVVWHPIVFGGARDPGYDRLFWNIIEYVQRTGGLATDGRTLNTFWRDRAQLYPSFTSLGRPCMQKTSLLKYHGKQTPER